ncbi:hypothetical protein [Crateriforma spongiae]|uniref:hypothetical protein n=1 Tax=Crateriforma spongiae TaxID=2724528 RepID=UPI001444BF2D|nr:hypothetical protein [Crateriforma spongiae]
MHSTPPSMSASLDNMDWIDTEAAESWSMSRPLAAFRFVVVLMLAALFWKWSFFLAADYVYSTWPLADDFFPGWLQSITTLRIGFFGGISALAFAVVTPTAKVRRTGCLIGFACITVLVWHQGSHNDMTFATAWWASLWAFWMSSRLVKLDELTADQRPAYERILIRRAAWLSRLIVSMILLGGAVGKWTDEYWSGQVFYEIYFFDRDYWVFNWLRANFDAETVRDIATWYSRKAVVVETLGGLFIWLLPPRHAAALGVLIFASIALLSNLLLFSVLLTMIGLASVGWFTVGTEDVSRND